MISRISPAEGTACADRLRMRRICTEGADSLLRIGIHLAPWQVLSRFDLLTIDVGPLPRWWYSRCWPSRKTLYCLASGAVVACARALTRSFGYWNMQGGWFCA
jgi:hypothetical protein